MEPVQAFIGLGSNLGDREEILRQAVQGLRLAGDVIAVSTVYETEPVGVPEEQPPYLNAVVLLSTPLTAAELMGHLLELEVAAGRTSRRPLAPRTLDLDLLLYGDEAIEEEGLVVPHPRMVERRFVLEPLLELRPDAVLPNGDPLGARLSEVADQQVRPFGPLWLPPDPDSAKALDREAVRQLKARRIASRRKRPGCLGVVLLVGLSIAAACSGGTGETSADTVAATPVVTAPQPDIIGSGATDPVAAVFFGLPQLPDCGSEMVEAAEGIESGHNETGLQCLLDALESGNEAQFRSERPTVGGHPVVSYYRTAEGVVHVFVDATRDPLGDPKWYGYTCGRLDVFTNGGGLRFAPADCGTLDL